MRSRVFATGVMLLAAILSAVAGEVSPSAFDEARARLSVLPLHPVEGLWQIPGHDSVLEIVRDSITPSGQVARYRIAVVEAEDLALAAGTVVGTVTPTAAHGVYDSRIFTDVEPGRHLIPSSPRRCTLTLDADESRLMVKHHRRKVTVRWWRLLPYMLRRVVSVSKDDAPDTDGLVRIYPESSTPQNPVYL
ncbi:MAG: hypothetical protein K2H98_03260 [Duncaniella sp.]|nr:hypothetical protein [Duncaniella sp.]